MNKLYAIILLSNEEMERKKWKSNLKTTGGVAGAKAQAAVYCLKNLIELKYRISQLI